MLSLFVSSGNAEIFSLSWIKLNPLASQAPSSPGIDGQASELRAVVWAVHNFKARPRPKEEKISDGESLPF